MLEKLYARLNRREFVSPDPLQFLYEYEDPSDREVVGLIASALAYGRVAQILKSVGAVLRRMGSSPHRFLMDSSPVSIRRTFRGFRHRFTTGAELSSLLIASRRTIEEYGSLGRCFAGCIGSDDENILPVLSSFVEKLNLMAGRNLGYLFPSPMQGSACKRPNLYLRWMIRRDAVDPGGWEGIRQSMLIVPLDTHMFRICRGAGFTRRKQADLKAAVEITAAFRRFSPEDPVKYDFALTRLGILKSSLLNTPHPTAGHRLHS